MNDITIEKYKSIYQYNVSQEIKDIIFCGDVHDKLESAVHMLTTMGVENTLLIICGDCGFGFYKYNHYVDVCRKIDKKLEQSNNYIICIRGNHDSPVYFNEYTPFSSERLFCVPDYSIINMAATSQTILCIGGAISIDRLSRIDYDSNNKKLYNGEACYKPKTYWKNETAVYSEEKLNDISDIAVIDTVVTHTCPSWCGLTDLCSVQWRFREDATLKDDMSNERQVMNHIYEYLTTHTHCISKWIYGHFHKSMSENYNDIGFYMLNELEMKQFYN